MSGGTACVGLELDPLGAAVASGPDSVERFGLPPAALLPARPGEPLRADTDLPPHRRGTGGGSEEAGERDPAGRFPLALAWEQLLEPPREDAHERAGRSWDAPSGAREAASPAAAVAAVGRVLLPDGDPHVALVLPEGCDAFAQQELLDAFQHTGNRPVLIWRAVAAAEAWIQRFGETIKAPEGVPHQEHAGDVLCVHLGVEAWEASRVAVLRSPGEPGPRWIPGHSSKDAHNNRGGVLAAWSASRGDDWRRAWCVDAAAEFGGDAAPTRRLRELLREPERALSRRLAAGGRDRPLGVVFTGPLCVLGGTSAPLAASLAASAGLAALPALAEGLDGVAPGLLAREAARLQARLAAGEPAWLDKLPRLRLQIEDAEGEPVWEDLLTEAWALGGTSLERREPLRGFQLSAGQPELRLPVHHEAFRTVRSLTAAFESPPARRLPVRLDVSIQVGQGQASLRVRPEDETGDAALDAGVLADWRKMDDTGEEPEEYLRNRPRAYPPTSPRAAEKTLWEAAASLAKRVTGSSAPSPAALKTLKEKLNAAPTGASTAEERQRKAFSSDGKVAPPREREAADALQQHLLSLLRSERHLDGVIPVLGYTSCHSDDFERLLLARIRDPFVTNKRPLWMAAGHCTRRPRIFRALAKAACKAADQRGRLDAETLKSLARVLQYRPRAADEVSLGLGHQLTRHALRVFDAELEAGNGKISFRSAACLIGYLLRLRITQSGFLPEGDRLTEAVTESFAAAVLAAPEAGGGRRRAGARRSEHDELAKQHPVAAERARRLPPLDMMGGQVDLPAALRQLLEYVDRRGTGVLRMGED